MMEEDLKPSLVVATRQRTPGGYGLLSKLAALATKLAGWQVIVADPMPDKCVIVMYPHTSNWDFPVGLLTKWAVGLDAKREALCFAGKESLFSGPWAGFFRAVGGFPVNRSTSTGFVPQMAERFASVQRMRFVIAPEGTRSYVPHVRSSFYHVALAANVPIILGAFDFPNKRVVVNAIFTPGGNVETDLAAIAGYYKALDNKGAKPSLAAPWKFR
jgi:1-acyl-sn-glycerol-3-phosphate acyltransferase